MSLFSNSIFSLVFIISIGFLLGKIKIGGISFGISAILFFAIFMGYKGLSIPKEFQTLGLVLFIYTIGIQAGPGFFKIFQKQGRLYFTLASILIGSAAITTYLLGITFEVEKDLLIGLFTGGMTSTPGLAVAIETTQSALAPIGYGVAYPFGVIGVILFIKLLPGISKKSISEAEKEIEQKTKADIPELFSRNFEVKNPNIIDKNLSEINLRKMTGAVISRIKHNEKTFSPTLETTLSVGDQIKAVGSQEALKKVESLVGPKIEEEIELSSEYQTGTILVTNTKVVNRTLRQLNISKAYNTSVTRIYRSGIELTPGPTSRLQMGDKVMVSAAKDDIKNLAKLLGNNDKKLLNTDLLPIFAGITLGILAGKINISFSESITFSPGLVGGILLVALFLGKIGKTGPVIWSLSVAANKIFRQLGLLLFLATVGTKSGGTIVSAFDKYGIELFIYGALITLTPLFVTAFVGVRIFKVNLLELMGIITGSISSAPGLAIVDSMSETEDSKKAYATVYPIALILLITCIQILVSLLSF